MFVLRIHRFQPAVHRFVSFSASMEMFRIAMDVPPADANWHLPPVRCVVVQDVLLFNLLIQIRKRNVSLFSCGGFEGSPVSYRTEV